MNKLTENFSLEELTVSESAARMGVKNDPRPEHLENIKLRLAPGLQLVRGLTGKPILVSSGYRCPEINVVNGGAMTRGSIEELLAITTLDEVREACERRLRKGEVSESDSQHMRGEAGDITSPGFGTPLALCRAIARSDIPFDQLIYEYESWAHVSFSAKPRRQVLTKTYGKPYVTGLPES